MWNGLEVLIPSLAMAGAFIGIAVTAYRATDGAKRRKPDDDDA